MRYIEAINNWDGIGMSLFMGGGISNCANWQLEMRDRLADVKPVKGEFVVINPRRADFPMNDPAAAEEQIKWEHDYLIRTDAVLFWFAPETLCPITLFELGTFVRTDIPVFVGVDPRYQRKQDVEIQLKLYRPDIKVVYSLEDLAEQVKEWVLSNDERRDKDIAARFAITTCQTLTPVSGQNHSSCACQCGELGSRTSSPRRGRLRSILSWFKRLFSA
jgi:hypothetical protein